MQKKHIRKKNQRFLLFLRLWTKKKDTQRGVSCVLPGTRTLDPLIKSQLLYQLS